MRHWSFLLSFAGACALGAAVPLFEISVPLMYAIAAVLIAFPLVITSQRDRPTRRPGP